MIYNFTCPICNKSFTDTDKKRKYCSQKCSKIARIKAIDKVCLNCGINFITKDSKRKFCSSKCANKFNQPKDTNKKEIFTCNWCGKQFEEWKYRHPKFCSKKCSGNFGGIQPKPKARRPESFITQNCIMCGKAYTVHKIQIELRNSKYCSNECKHESQTLKMMGKNNPNWQGGIEKPDYGSNWDKQKRKAKKRDNYACQKCGYKYGGDKFLDVHHIIPFRLFDNYKTANKLENLITLCRTCHVKAEIELRKINQT